MKRMIYLIGLFGLCWQINIGTQNEPKGYFDRFKQWLTQTFSRSGKILEKDVRDLGLMPPEKVNLIKQQANVIKNVPNRLMAIIAGDVGLALASGSLLTILGYMTGNEKIFDYAFLLGVTLTSASVIKAAQHHLEEAFRTDPLTLTQKIDIERLFFEKILSVSNAFPTLQMKLNEIIRLMLIYKKENSTEARIRVMALQRLKDDIEKSALFKKTRELSRLDPLQLRLLTLKRDKLSAIDFKALKEIEINNYIRTFSSDVKTMLHNQDLWNMLKEELRIISSMTLLERELSIEKQLQRFRLEYEYIAFKSVLLALNKDTTLLRILYEHEYKKMRMNTLQLKLWLNAQQKEPFYNEKLLAKVMSEVEAKNLSRLKKEFEFIK